MPGLRTAQLRHARYYCAIAAQADALYIKGGSSTVTGLTLFDQERSQIDTALNWVQLQPAEALLDELLLTFIDVTSSIGDLRYDPGRERIAQLEATLLAAQRLRRGAAEGMVLGHLGLAYFDLNNISKSVDFHEQALRISRELGDRQAEGRDLGNLGLAHAFANDSSRALAAVEAGCQADLARFW